MTVVGGTAVEGLNRLQARQNLINGVLKGQKHGCYSLQEAASLWTVVGFMVKESQKETQETKREEEDLSELSESVPLKPREI
jgi:hypothetical protein